RSSLVRRGNAPDREGRGGGDRPRRLHRRGRRGFACGDPSGRAREPHQPLLHGRRCLPRVPRGARPSRSGGAGNRAEGGAMSRILAGNWKMNLSLDEARSLLRAVGAPAAQGGPLTTVVFPPLTLLATLASERRPTDPKLGVQNCHAEPKGAFTGEVSPEMARDCGAEFALVGHSERRR